MTAEQLAGFRAKGLLLDPKYDRLIPPQQHLDAVEKLKEKTLSITYAGCNSDDNKYFLDFDVTVTNFDKSKNAVITIFTTENPISLSGKITVENGTNKRKVLHFEKTNETVVNFLSSNREFKAEIYCEGLQVETKIFEIECIKNNNVKIVIDPGHGYTKGNTGAVCYIYTHKLMGQNGNPIQNENGEFKTEKSNILKLPQYVIDDPNTWIVSKVEDPNHNERLLVFEISEKLNQLLKNNGYTSYLTREKAVIQGNDDSNSRNARIDLANKNKAQYFISIHADGADNNTSSGAHTIYPKISDKKLSADSKQLGEDIFKFYNVVQVEKLSPKEDVRGLQVLSSSNKADRKVLVELGFVTTPRDAKAMFTNIETIAKQLFQGLEYNIKNRFK